MFDNTRHKVTFLPEDDSLPNQDALKRHCLDSASLWMLQRRANRPYVVPRRLPKVAGGV